MTLLAVPNLSEGRDASIIGALRESVLSSGARVLDTHTDAIHNRTVLTVTAPDETLVEAMIDLARTADRLIDLSEHDGVHPRMGTLDVCPFVPHHRSIDAAIEAARATARGIGEAGVPVFLYGAGGAPDLPQLRRGGLESLIDRVAEGVAPDFGPARIEPDSGVVCVGARGPLIAFNINIEADLGAARAIAAEVRGGASKVPGLRALGLEMPAGSQVSTNITQPEVAGIPETYAAVEGVTHRLGTAVVSTEIVGLVERRFMPSRDAKATRLLIEPGRSVESALRS